ncbi:hypothetical protein DUI87_29915 [Hirundo rustica rustica]|uniref:ribonuclease H n=1 Tax=Hirundo rustica rustica TaxID=333673 RepID=A0A3M0IYJ6_HIRRU|nr:hypothetical protein DUI87_29915 [Hirundo rustica rustica]
MVTSNWKRLEVKGEKVRHQDPNTLQSEGEWRLTVDYRALNEVIPPLSAAVPDVLELQYELESKAAKWYATNDIANAFFSILLAAERRPQFAFTWRGVQYTWNRLPQGWKYSPTICHGLIQTALDKDEAPEHLQYIDDIIVWGNTTAEVFESHKLLKEKAGSSQLAEPKAVQLALDIAEREKWPKLCLYTDSWMVANALWGCLEKWNKAYWQHRGKPIWAAEERKDIATRVEKLPLKVCQVDALVPESQANEEHRNNEQVIHDCETCAAIKQVKPLWYGGWWSKYKYGEAWQIDYFTLPQTCQGHLINQLGEDGVVLSATMGDFNCCKERDEQYSLKQARENRLFSEVLQSQEFRVSGTSIAEEKQMDSQPFRVICQRAASQRSVKGEGLKQDPACTRKKVLSHSQNLKRRTGTIYNGHESLDLEGQILMSWARLLLE